jgi:hypothetical protein
MGVEVTETFKVAEAGLDELDHYEVTNAQRGVIDGGIRGSLSDAFLELVISIEELRILKSKPLYTKPHLWTTLPIALLVYVALAYKCSKDKQPWYKKFTPGAPG